MSDYIEKKAGRHFNNYKGQVILNKNNPEIQPIYNKFLTVFDKNKDNILDSDEIKSVWNNILAANKNGDDIITEKEITATLKKNNDLSKLKLSAKEILVFMKLLDDSIDEYFANIKANVHKNLMKRLKTKYPSDKYKIESVNKRDSSQILITSKNNNKAVAGYLIFENGQYQKYELSNDTLTTITYDENHQYLYHSKFNKTTGKSTDSVSTAIHKDITAKNKLGLPTTGKDLEKHIMQITSENVMDVWNNYKSNFGETLSEAINKEWGLDKKIKQKLLKHINKCAYESSYGFLRPTKEMRDFQQNKIGDCWFLATIAAIQRSPKGQQLLDSMITDNNDGTYTVKFRGTDKKYTVSITELKSKHKYALNSTNIRILELAAKKHYKISGINTGNPAWAMELLLGTGDKFKNLARIFMPKPNPQEIKKLLNNENIIITTSINPISKLWGLMVKDIPETADYKNDIATAHAYAIVNIDDKNIYLKNPWYTQKTMAVPLDVFEEYFGNIQYTEIT